MLSTRWYPLRDVFTEMNRLQGEMNHLFGRDGSDTRPAWSRGYPAVNLWEDQDQVYLEAELPGLVLEDLEIYVQEGNQLSIKGERKRPDIENGTWHRRERGFGTFIRVVKLPFPVDADQVEAHFKHGVLTIELPKREDVKPRRIEVKTD
ncbi:MAG: Hsp20/alpha crystallin family protein [Pirellulales bacterium]